MFSIKHMTKIVKNSNKKQIFFVLIVKKHLPSAYYNMFVKYLIGHTHQNKKKMFQNQYNFIVTPI